MAPAADAGFPPVLVVGAVRNCARHLARDVARVAAALAPCAALEWLLVESDSDDATVAELEALAARIPGFAFRTLGDLRDALPLRTDRLAHCRNVTVAAARDSDAAFVAVVDFDGLNTRLDRAGIATCFDRDDWDMVAANQAGPYYDIWALRHPLWCPNDCWAQHRFLRARGVPKVRAVHDAVESRKIRIDPAEAWLPVTSAFGGFALYRREHFVQGRYVGLAEDGSETCEHVAFNSGLAAAGARLFINPALINADYTEHTRHLRPGLRTIRRVTGTVRGLARALVPGRDSS